jgi:alpha-1,2-mannosyltransferase
MTRRTTTAALVAANLAAIAFSFPSWTAHGVSLLPYRLDLDVYRIGGQVWLTGGNLYGLLPKTVQGVRLPFTYPPFAAIALSPLTVIPLLAAGIIVTLATIALLAGTLRMYLPPLGWPLACVLPVALMLEPVRSTIDYGQVNVVLMALITADCLSRAPRWPRGSLTGLAAAVKLTPLPFALFFLVRRDYRAAAAMIASFAACTGLGFALASADSARYWTSVVFDTGRIGSQVYAGDQSIAGMLARAGLLPGTPAATSLWLALSMVVLAAAWLGMRRALASSDTGLALALNAFAALLISPVSWTHHWVWAGPALLALAAAGRARRLPGAWPAAVCGLVLFVGSPQWWLPHGANRELHWVPWEQAVGGCYVLFAAGVLLMACLLPSAATPPVPTLPASALRAFLAHHRDPVAVRIGYVAAAVPGGVAVRLDEHGRPDGTKGGDRLIGRVALQDDLHRVTRIRDRESLPRHGVPAAERDDGVAEPEFQVFGGSLGGSPEGLRAPEQAEVEGERAVHVGRVQVEHDGRERHRFLLLSRRSR